MWADVFQGYKLRVWFEDEARVGTKPSPKKRLTARGVKPRVVQGHTYESFWVYGAVDVTSGESVFVEWSHLDGECFEHFLQELSRQGGEDEVHLLILDNAGAHKNRSIRWPHDVFALYLPAYAPELNPIERLWLEMRRALKHWYHDLDSLRRDLDDWYASLEPAVLLQLVQFPYINSAISSALFPLMV